MNPKVLVPFSKGVEEIEFTTIVDVLRRAGAHVTTASLEGALVEGRSGIRIQADTTLDVALSPAVTYDMVVLPGGLPNAHILRDDPRIIALLQSTAKAERPVAAICAAPSALFKAGLLKDHTATAYPGCLPDLPSEQQSDDAVVISGNITTSRGPGTAMAFALSLVATLFGDAKADEVAEELLA